MEAVVFFGMGWLSCLIALVTGYGLRNPVKRLTPGKVKPALPASIQTGESQKEG